MATKQNKLTRSVLTLALAIPLSAAAQPKSVPANGKLKIFILAGQSNMVGFVKDIRKDLGIENLPFVIANTGMGGWDIPARYKAKVEKLMEAQLALANATKYPEFAGNVAGVETRDFQRSREQSPSKQDCHWMRNWETYYLIGKGMGDALVGLPPE